MQAELQNGRWAMLGVAGILLPELAANLGVSWPGAGVPWYDAGKFEYFADAKTLFGIQMLLFAWVEINRCGAHLTPPSCWQILGNVTPPYWCKAKYTYRVRMSRFSTHLTAPGWRQGYTVAAIG